MQLGKVRAAVPRRYKPRKFLLRPVIVCVRAPEIRYVEARLEARHKHVERARKKFLSHLRVVLCLQGACHHIARADGHAPARVCLLLREWAEIVDLARVLVRIGASNEHEDAVGVLAGDLSAHDLGAVFQPLCAETGAVVTCGCGRGDELIRIRLRRVLQAAIGHSVPVELQLVEMDEVCVEGIKDIWLIGKRVKADLPVPDCAGVAVPERAVQDAQPMHRVLAHGKAEPVQVVAEEAEALHVLLRAAGHGLDLRIASAVSDAEHPDLRRRKRRLAVLPRQHGKLLLVTPQLRPWQEEAAHVVNVKELPGLQEEGRAAQRPAVQALALLVAEQCLDAVDHELGKLCAKLPLAASAVVEVAPRRRPKILTGALVCLSLLCPLVYDALMRRHARPP